MISHYGYHWQPGSLWNSTIGCLWQRKVSSKSLCMFQLLKQDDNKGVMYSYTIPMGEGDSETENRHGDKHGNHHGNKRKHPDRTTFVDPDAVQQDENQYNDRYRSYLNRVRSQQSANRQADAQTDNRRRVSQPSQSGSSYQPVQPLRTADTYNAAQYPARGSTRRQPAVQPQGSYPLQPNPANTASGYQYPAQTQQRGYPNYQNGYQRAGYNQYPQADTRGAPYVLPLQGGQNNYPYQQPQRQPSYLPAQGGNKYQAQRGSISYIPPNYPNQRQELSLGQTQQDNRYNGYNSGSQNQGYRGTVNDQIALNLGSERRLQIGEPLDSSATFSWKISGFTECSRTCGGGKKTDK